MLNQKFNCGLEASLAVLSGKWKPLVLFHLAHEIHRYGQLKRAIGKVSDKVLIQQLKELQQDGVVERTDYGEIPPKVEYSLTGFGESLARALAPLCQWGELHTEQIGNIVRNREKPQSDHQ
ncbi:MAG: winged helix-turn-helix transcriptional regulator [Advenella sp.]